MPSDWGVEKPSWIFGLYGDANLIKVYNWIGITVKAKHPRSFFYSPITGHRLVEQGHPNNRTTFKNTVHNKKKMLNMATLRFCSSASSSQFPICLKFWIYIANV